MRTAVPPYHYLIPALIVAVELDSDTGAYHHAWLELSPSTKDAYRVLSHGRSGTVTESYALEENNVPAAVGTVVWLRVRDEDGEVHYAFTCGCPTCGSDCAPCWQGVEVTGPALPSIDEDGLWELLDLTGKAGSVLGIGTGDAPATYDSISGGSW